MCSGSGTELKCNEGREGRRGWGKVAVHACLTSCSPKQGCPTRSPQGAKSNFFPAIFSRYLLQTSPWVSGSPSPRIQSPSVPPRCNPPFSGQPVCRIRDLIHDMRTPEDKHYLATKLNEVVEANEFIEAARIRDKLADHATRRWARPIPTVWTRRACVHARGGSGGQSTLACPRCAPVTR